MSLETKSFVFGEFTLETKEKVLLRNGKPFPLTPKAFQLLLVLVKNHGQIVEKEDLMKAVWADSFVEEVNLPFTISVLRKALGDNKSDPRFIENVPRRGYRFIAEVKKISFDKISTNLIQSELQETSQPKKKPFVFILASVAIVFCLIGFAVWSILYSYPNSELKAPILSAPFHSEKFSSSGKVHHAAISPAGKFVAFIDEIAGKQSVWLRNLVTLENIQIVPPSDESYHGIIFSHDGQTIYFVRTPMLQQSHDSIYRVSVFGGVPEKILEFTEGWISLSPDDKQISFVRCPYKTDNFCSLLIADTTGKNERQLVTRPHPIRISDNQFSPDGESIAFASGNSENGGNDFKLFSFNLVNNVETEISTERFFEIKNLKWLPDGKNLLLTAMEQLDGKAKIWHASAETGKIQLLTNDATDYLEISLSQDASQMIAVQFSNNFQIYLINDNSTKPIIAAREAVFTPDGKILFSADDNDIWTIQRDGTEQRQLTNNSGKDFSPLASPDGQFIYFTSTRTGSNQIWRMNKDGINQIQITKAEGGYPRSISPDGKWIYYESGFHQTLWRVAWDGSEESEVYERKLYHPTSSPNGSHAAFFYRDKEHDNRVKVGVITIADKKAIKSLEFAEKSSYPVDIAWSNDSQTIYYITFNNSKNTLWAQSLNEENSRLVADLGDKEIDHISISPDGNSFACIRGEWLHDAILLKGLK